MTDKLSQVFQAIQEVQNKMNDGTQNIILDKEKLDTSECSQEGLGGDIN